MSASDHLGSFLIWNKWYGWSVTWSK